MYLTYTRTYTLLFIVKACGPIEMNRLLMFALILFAYSVALAKSAINVRSLTIIEL